MAVVRPRKRGLAGHLKPSVGHGGAMKQRHVVRVGSVRAPSVYKQMPALMSDKKEQRGKMNAKKKKEEGEQNDLASQR